MIGRIIRSPEILEDDAYLPLLFLAGGITDCADWQTPTSVKIAEKIRLNIANPRRESWDMSQSDIISKEQIAWEYNLLKRTDIFFFWFTKETLNPITLFEYGKAITTGKPIYVGTHPEYKRRFDVIVQSQLEKGYDFKIYDNLYDMIENLIESYNLKKDI